jgi:tetratricopeptide (TPR) repeat protein
MISRLSRVLLILLTVVAAISLSWADTAKELLVAGRIDDAIAELNGRISASPGDAESDNLLCRAYFAVEDWDRAEFSCRKAAELAPDNSRFHLWLGRVYGEKADRAGVLSAAGMAPKIRVEFERAVQLNPKDIDARLDLAEFYVEAPGFMGGGAAKARNQAQFVGITNPGREHWIYARIAEKNKDFGTAEREYRQYVDLSHGDAEAWLNLALCFRRKNRQEEMEKAIVKLSQAPVAKPDVLMEAAGILIRAKRNYSLAGELLHRYLTAGPVEAAPAFKAHYLLGVLLEEQGDKAGAAQEYRASLSMARNFGNAQQALNHVDRHH